MMRNAPFFVVKESYLRKDDLVLAKSTNDKYFVYNPNRQGISKEEGYNLSDTFFFGQQWSWNLKKLYRLWLDYRKRKLLQELFPLFREIGFYVTTNRSFKELDRYLEDEFKKMETKKRRKKKSDEEKAKIF